MQINFYLQTEKSPAGIYVRLRDGINIDCKAKTKYSIDPVNWDNGLVKVKGSAKLKKIKEQGITAKFSKLAEGKSLNHKLQTFKTNLLSHYNESVNKSEINSEWLKEFINPTTKSQAIPDTLLAYFDVFLAEKKADFKSTSYAKLSGVKNLIERFVKKRGKDIKIKDIGSNFKLEFEQYCKGEKYSHNTVSRVIKFIKSVSYHARGNGIETHPQLDGLRVKLQPSEKIYLTFDEITTIEKAKLQHDYLENARDWLIISTETAQRVSDFMRFRKEFITKLEGKEFVDFKQIKTGKDMRVPLSSKVLSILKKRKGEFPRQISDQKYNEYIKEVCKIAKLTDKVKGRKIDPEIMRRKSGEFEKWELISSHVGRRSFASNYYGIKPISVLMYMTGHTTEKMFREYIGKSDNDRALEAAKWF